MNGPCKLVHSKLQCNIIIFRAWSERVFKGFKQYKISLRIIVHLCRKSLFQGSFFNLWFILDKMCTFCCQLFFFKQVLYKYELNDSLKLIEHFYCIMLPDENTFVQSLHAIGLINHVGSSSHGNFNGRG